MGAQQHLDGQPVWSRYTEGMRVFAGKVKGGVIVPESTENLVEGMTVGVVANDGEASFTATPEEEAALLAALAEREDTISGDDLLSRLR